MNRMVGMSKPQELARFVFGSEGTIAGKVYGTIVVQALIAAGGKPFEDDLWRLIVLVDTTMIVLWMAHVYAHGLGDSIRAGRRLHAGEFGRIARQELELPEVAVAPTAVLVLGAVGLLDGRTAVALA